MRGSIATVGIFATLLISTVGNSAEAQVVGNPAGTLPPPGLGEAPAQVLATYLRLRAVITGERPVVVLCGEHQATVMTPEFRAFLTGPSRLADSIHINADCPRGMEYHEWIGVSTENTDLVVIAHLAFGPLSSIVEAYSRPRYNETPPIARGRLERFEWNHLIVNGGESLTFSNFRPVDD